MRKKIIAGNWKMNKTVNQAKDLLLGINKLVITHNLSCELIVCPPFLYLKYANEVFHHNKVQIGSQNVSEFKNGAYTGEISAELLHSIETDYAIIGHSERRQYFNDTDEIVLEKVKRCFENKIKPIICVGESLKQRKNNKYFEIIKNQLKLILQLSEKEIRKTVIAYEPVWAIGTGETANPLQAQEVHAFIRKLISDDYGNETSENISILYGGSVKSNNAQELFAQKDIDGGLIGGASLDLDEFTHIITALCKAN